MIWVCPSLKSISSICDFMCRADLTDKSDIFHLLSNDTGCDWLFLNEVVDPPLNYVVGIDMDKLFKLLALLRIQSLPFVLQNNLVYSAAKKLYLRFCLLSSMLSVNMDWLMLVTVKEQYDSQIFV